MSLRMELIHHPVSNLIESMISVYSGIESTHAIINYALDVLVDGNDSPNPQPEITYLKNRKNTLALTIGSR